MTASWNPTLPRLSARTQASALRIAIFALRVVGPRVSSSLGGFAARTIGRMLPGSGVADKNLSRALPDLDAAARKAIVIAAWDNLGRISGELPHLAGYRRTVSGRGWEVEGEEHVAFLRDAGTQALFFSGHIGNWEMILPIAAGLGLPVSGFYRAASNPSVDRAVQSMRRDALGAGNSMFPKGAAGARAALTHLRGGGSLGFLADQKMNEGISVPFFGRPAMTAPALAQMALRFSLPILPVYILRAGPGRFRMVCEQPLSVARTGDRQADVYAISLAVNVTLERWIRARPGSWLWMHRRWPKAAISGSAAN